jgi:NAD-dependent SIR2 family protein deacetylase
MSIDIARTILESESIIICTGAGMGVDSGLATFRGPTAKGWTHTITGEDIDYYDICQGTYFSKPNHPMKSEAIAFWQSCQQAYNSANPHQGYQILMKWVNKKPYFIYTTNVDHHWSRVGVPADRLYEIHGSIESLQCSYPRNNQCLKLSPWKPNGTIDHCLSCDQPMRPHILMFNDGGYIDEHDRSIRMGYQKFIAENRQRKVAIIVIGAGQAVPTIKYEVEMLLKKLPNANVIKINPDVLPSRYSIALGALEALKEVDGQMSVLANN